MAEDAKIEKMSAGPFEEGPRNDFCIQVEGKNLFVPTAILSAMSPIFKKLCGNENDGIELTNQKYKEVLTMLKCIIPHPTIEPVTEENLEVLLKLGTFYLVRVLQENCIAFINLRVKEMKFTDTASFSYLKMVSNYDGVKVFDSLIDLLIRQVSNLEKEFLAKNDHHLPPEISSRLYRHCLLKFKDLQHLPNESKSDSSDDCLDEEFCGTCSICGRQAVCLY